MPVILLIGTTKHRVWDLIQSFLGNSKPAPKPLQRRKEVIIAREITIRIVGRNEKTRIARIRNQVDGGYISTLRMAFGESTEVQIVTATVSVSPIFTGLTSLTIALSGSHYVA